MTISIFAIARLLLNVPAGLAADKYGRKPLLTIGPFITALGMIACGLSSSFSQLLFWRFVTGIGSALQMCGAQLYLADVSVPANRARVLGANTSAALLGVSVGPAIGGNLAVMSGISSVFFVTGSLAVRIRRGIEEQLEVLNCTTLSFTLRDDCARPPLFLSLPLLPTLPSPFSLSPSLSHPLLLRPWPRSGGRSDSKSRTRCW